MHLGIEYSTTVSKKEFNQTQWLQGIQDYQGYRDHVVKTVEPKYKIGAKGFPMTGYLNDARHAVMIQCAIPSPSIIDNNESISSATMAQECYPVIIESNSSSTLLFNESYHKSMHGHMDHVANLKIDIISGG